MNKVFYALHQEEAAPLEVEVERLQGLMEGEDLSAYFEIKGQFVARLQQSAARSISIESDCWDAVQHALQASNSGARRSSAGIRWSPHTCGEIATALSVDGIRGMDGVDLLVSFLSWTTARSMQVFVVAE